MILYLFLITIVFIVYSEYSVGSILFRPDSYGKISMNIGSMFYFMMNPFYETHLWSLQTLDINYAFIIIVSFILFSIINYNNEKQSWYTFEEKEYEKI